MNNIKYFIQSVEGGDIADLLMKGHDGNFSLIGQDGRRHSTTTTRFQSQQGS